MDQTKELRILTLNTWLLETPIFSIPIAQDITKRLKMLPKLILETKADIVFLQEVWKAKFVNFIENELSQHGYHIAHYNSSLFRMGNGLLTISKFPFQPTNNNLVTTKTYKKRTRLDEHAVKKGATMCSVKHPELGNLKLFNTHLGATTLDKSNMQPKRSHYLRRHHQLMDLANFVKENSSDQENFILGGDFNINEHCFRNHSYVIDRDYDPAYRSLFNELDLIDTYRHVNGEFNTLDDNYLGFTVNAHKNPYVNGTVNKSFAKFGRIDYIFLSASTGATIEKSEVVFMPKSPELAISDHFGVLTKLKL